MGTVEATYAQHAVWFTEQAGAAATAYHMAVGIHFDARLDTEALVAACTAVIERHPVLDARVVTDADGVPRLAPGPARPPVTFAELTEERVAEEIARGYSLTDGPLSRFVLLTAVDGRHLLLVTAHHLVFDGTSKEVLVGDLAAAYRTAAAGEPVRLPPLPDGYAGHATAERDRVAADLPAARAYWARHRPDPTDVVLPGLTRVPAAAEPGRAVPVPLGDLADGLDRAATTVGVTRFELFLTALHLLVYRYGNRDTPVGVALSTRTPEQADQVGLFVNELPVTAPTPTGTVDGYARKVRARLRELYRHRAVPLTHAVPGLRPAPALTAVSVGYRRRGTEPTFTDVGSRVEWTLFSGSARNALHVQVVDAPTGWTVTLQHSPTALDADGVTRIGAHLRTLLAAVVADPGLAVADLPVLPPDETDMVLRRWNDTGRTHPADVDLPTLFAAQVRTRPQAVAVVDGDLTLSYADLDAAAARLARLLRERGVGPGARVAVALDRSWELVATLLAVLRCRAAYVPVDPGHPVARQDLVLADADPTLVVTTTALAARLDRPALTVDALPDRPDPTDSAADDVDPGRPLRAEPAYVLYTSGSTGQPKGVVVAHAALTNLLLGLREVLDSRPEHRWLQLTSPAFDISGVEIWLPLTTGGRVVVAAGISPLDGAGVLRLVRTAAVTHVQATPSGWRVLLEAGLGAAGTPPLVGVTGGEALPVPLARNLRSRLTRLVNGYGPTEATIYATMADVPADPDEVTIGLPLPGTRAYLLDEESRPVPVGVPGELCLAGSGLAEGYRGRPDLTADRFVDDPYGGPGERLYRTGDRCRWRPDGRIEFLGRTDEQVKIRGHRIELGEVTARLLEHPGVAAGTVQTCPDTETGEPTLVGYLVPRGAAPDPADLRRHLAVSLPAAMVPGEWVVLDRLPLGPSGKVDRAALPVPVARRGARSDDVDPATGGADGADELVEQLRTIWQEVLRIPDVGEHEDLFDLGGHSLTITRISGRIQQRLGVEVPLDTFFDTPTIAEIADFVRRSGEGH
ncbi:amino acid adenylation domain-containing protein [Micromonospora sp. NPDC000207]|uniref:non-ribosomal peptide synthetase n=1 Tax=Micromonospora sp. NPDC000207 TaxID=3154246 RepID=UPI0033273EB5